MAVLIHMPRYNDFMIEVAIAKWLVKKGDKISKGDMLAKIIVDDVNVSLESDYEGTILFIATQEDQIVPLYGLLVIVGEEGEDISELLYEITPPEKIFLKKETTITSKPLFILDKNITLEEIVPVTMPILSDTMIEGIVNVWHKKIGDTIEEGDILVDMENDFFATMEYESIYNGTLLYIQEENKIIPVGGLLIIIREQGEDISELLYEMTPPKNTSKIETTMHLKLIQNVDRVLIPEGVELITMPKLSDSTLIGYIVNN